jgi:putative colanic acid biosynthesis UDP-glucose lipid carrier transferase
MATPSSVRYVRLAMTAPSRSVDSNARTPVEGERELRYSDVVPAPSSRLPRAVSLTEKRPGSVPPPADTEILTAVTDVLLAAAYADGTLCGRERRSVQRIVSRLGGETLPESLLARIDAFDPARFDLQAAAERLLEIPPAERRHVLELVREVCDANNAFDLEEERFLIGLTRALALSDEDIADLVIVAPEGIHGQSKRAFDVAFASAFLAASWPALLAIAIGVCATSPGPALFRQLRSGRDGKPIEVWKFRTMRTTENGGDVRQATRADPRITRLGAFLRRTSLDELPQFVNVLFGDMSVVGPRPHAVAHNRHYRTKIVEYMLRHKVKPGITGWAQVNGWRGETDTLDKMVQRVAHDLDYIRRWSFWLDLKIVGLTVLGRKVRSNAY